MSKVHVADIPHAGEIESSIRQAAQDGVLVAGDLTSEDAAIAAIAADQAKAHVADKPRHEGAKLAIRQMEDATGNTGLAEGGSLDDIYAAVPGTWPRGMSPGI